MTAIDPSAALAAVIRRQVASLGRPLGATGKASATRPRGNESTEPEADVATLVARRVKAIDPDDPQRHRKAFRVFLESILLAEFGDNLINDVGFHQLIEDVHNQMAADPELSGSIHEAASRMLGSHAR